MTLKRFENWLGCRIYGHFPVERTFALRPNAAAERHGLLMLKHALTCRKVPAPGMDNTVTVTVCGRCGKTLS